jgi:hypothetical protein
MVTSPTATTITTNVRQVLFEAIQAILVSVDCENVHDFALPPITSYDELMVLLRVDEGFDESKLEAWFMGRDRFVHDPNTRGTFTRYDQNHRVDIVGMAWRDSFRDSYEYMQDKGELVARTLEKNKSLGSTVTNPSIQEISGLEVNYAWGPHGGEVYLYRVGMRFNALVGLEEAGGRV